MDTPPDKRVVACNYAEGTKSVAPGALAFVLFGYRGMGNRHVEVLVRSRGRRHIRKVERLYRLKNFRLKTIPASHPQYVRLIDHGDAEALLQDLVACHDRELREHEAVEMRRMLAAAKGTTP